MSCKITNCVRVVSKDGYCKEHWRQWRQGTLCDGRIKSIRRCSVQNCNNKHAAKGFCASHYAQFRKGELGKVIRGYISRKGKSESVEYRAWYNMKDRCLNKNSKDYPTYGGAGITVSQEWQDSFEQFYIDMGDRPDGYSLERIDNTKGYSKENCKWASCKEQASNTLRNKIDFDPFLQ